MKHLKLDGCRVALLATDGFEESELLQPKQALVESGAVVEILSLKNGSIRSWKDNNWGTEIAVDREVYGASAKDFDALLLPGGVMNPDHLRNDAAAVNFVKEFVVAGKPIAAICHGPQLLIDADGVKGRRMTSWPSLKKDFANAGAEWSDSEVVTDAGLVTSRKPADIPAFNEKMIAAFLEGAHQRDKKGTA